MIKILGIIITAIVLGLITIFFFNLSISETEPTWKDIAIFGILIFWISIDGLKGK